MNCEQLLRFNIYADNSIVDSTYEFIDNYENGIGLRNHKDYGFGEKYKYNVIMHGVYIKFWKTYEL